MFIKDLPPSSWNPAQCWSWQHQPSQAHTVSSARWGQQGRVSPRVQELCHTACSAMSREGAGDLLPIAPRYLAAPCPTARLILPLQLTAQPAPATSCYQPLKSHLFSLPFVGAALSVLTPDPTEILLAIVFTRGLEVEFFLRGRSLPSCVQPRMPHGPSQLGNLQSLQLGTGMLLLPSQPRIQSSPSILEKPGKKRCSPSAGRSLEEVPHSLQWLLLNFHGTPALSGY